MKAIVLRKFGTPEVLKCEYDYPEPELFDNQVLIKVVAAGINPLDIKIREGELRLVTGSKFPLILGNDVSGTIVKCGREVHNYKIGDQVYCMNDSNKKFNFYGFAKSGSYAEYCATREDTLSLKPNSITSEEAAALPLCCLTAYQTLVIKAQIKKGNKVLINGASGGVGVYAVQIAKAYGATVTAVCSNKNIDFVKALGADFTFDYKEKDIGRLMNKFDIIFDVIAVSSYWKCKNILSKEGIYISNIAKPMNILTTYLFPIFRLFDFKKRSTYAWVKPLGKDLNIITKMIEEDKIRPVIDKTFSFNEIQEAHKYLEIGGFRGKIVISLK